MNIKNKVKDISIKNTAGSVTDTFESNIVLKSPDNSVVIERGSQCEIVGLDVDDTAPFMSIDGDIQVEDHNAVNSIIALLTTDDMAGVVVKINTALATDGSSVRAEVIAGGTASANLRFYSIASGSTTIELIDPDGILGDLGHVVGVINSVNDNSISLKSASSGAGTIGNAEDGSYMDGAIGVYTSDILTPDTPVGHAVDWINEYLLALTPEDSGVSLDGSDLSLDGISFEDGYISNDLSGSSIINYGGVYIAGASSSRILTRSQVADVIHLVTIPFENADKGTIEIELNGVSLGQFDLEAPFNESLRRGSQDVNIPAYDASGEEMDIVSINWYDNFAPYQEGVVQLFTSNASAVLQNGYNLVRAIHTVGVDVRTTNDFEFFFNNTVDLPSVNAGSVSLAKGGGISTRQMSGVTLIDGGTDDITSPVFDDIVKYAYPQNIFSIDGDLFVTTLVPYNDADLTGNSSPLEFQDAVGFSAKTISLKSDILYYDIPSVNVDAVNMVGIFTVSDAETDTWVVDTYAPNNNSDLVENFNDESRRMYYGTPYEGSVTGISGLDITDTGSDFTGMLGFWVKNNNTGSYAKITAVAGDTATLDSNDFALGHTFEVYVTGSLMLLSDKGNFNSSASLVGRDYDYIAPSDTTEAVALLGRTTRPSINFSANHFPAGSPSYVSLDGRYATYITYFRTSEVRTGMKLIFKGFSSLIEFQAFMQEIRVTIPFDDSADAGYDGTAFNPNTGNFPALYRGLLYKADGSGQFDSSLGDPDTGLGMRLGEPTLTANGIEVDFTTGTLTNLDADLHYFIEVIIKNTAPVFSLSTAILTEIEMTER